MPFACWVSGMFDIGGMGLGPVHIVAFSITFLVIITVSIRSGRNVRDADTFVAGHGTGGLGITMGVFMSLAVGGGCTIGTAQLAFQFGFSGMWFTLGTSLGFVLLAQLLTVPLRNSGQKTVHDLFAARFGTVVGTVSTILSGVCMLPTAVSQVASASILLGQVLAVPHKLSVAITIALMLVTVLFGGVIASGYVGRIKILLTGGALLVCLALVIFHTYGLRTFWEELPAASYITLFSRGGARDLFNAVAIGFGMLAIQSNAMGILSAKSVATAKRALYICAAIVPLLGFCSTCVGMYMRTAYPQIDPAVSFPLFILRYFPPAAGGVLIATLLLSVVTSGANASMGIGVILSREIVRRLKCIRPGGRGELLLNRIVITAVLLSCMALVLVQKGQITILDWNYISGSLRSAIVFPAFWATVRCKRSIPRGYVIAAMLLGPMSVVCDYLFLNIQGGPLTAGLLAGFLCVLVGWLREHHTTNGEATSPKNTE